MDDERCRRVRVPSHTQDYLPSLHGSRPCDCRHFPLLHAAVAFPYSMTAVASPDYTISSPQKGMELNALCAAYPIFGPRWQKTERQPSHALSGLCTEASSNSRSSDPRSPHHTAGWKVSCPKQQQLRSKGRTGREQDSRASVVQRDTTIRAC
jgi:hypothetical protein